jgi:hypothetical protein
VPIPLKIYTYSLLWPLLIFQVAFASCKEDSHRVVDFRQAAAQNNKKSSEEASQWFLKIKPRCYLSSRRKRIVCPFL